MKLTTSFVSDIVLSTTGARQFYPTNVGISPPFDNSRKLDELSLSRRSAILMDWTSRAFLYADVEEKGYLTKHQYIVAMTALFGYCPDKWELKEVFSTDESNAKNLMNFESFHQKAKKKMFLLNQEPFDVSYFFSQLDRGCKGYFVLNDLLAVAKDMNFRISKAVLKNAFRELDSRKRGYIDFDDLSDRISTI